jgi:hypothetical protein
MNGNDAMNVTSSKVDPAVACSRLMLDGEAAIVRHRPPERPIHPDATLQALRHALSQLLTHTHKYEK